MNLVRRAVYVDGGLCCLLAFVLVTVFGCGFGLCSGFLGLDLLSWFGFVGVCVVSVLICCLLLILVFCLPAWCLSLWCWRNTVNAISLFWVCV